MVTNAQSSQDIDQLRLLSIFHYIVAGVIGLFSLIPIIHVVLGIALVTGSLDGFHRGDQPPEFMGWLFIILPSVFILSGLVISFFVAFAGRHLAVCSCYNFCLVVAAIECMFMPIGTALGVFTIIVLMRPNVKELFGVGQLHTYSDTHPAPSS